jgi:hypothetical protein
MPTTNETATKEIRVFQSTAKGAANKKSRVLGAVRKGTMSVVEAEANQKHDIELGKILTLDEIALAAKGEGRKRGNANGTSNTVASALSKGSRIRSQFRAGKLTKEQVEEIYNKDALLQTKFTLESLMAPARYTVVTVDVPVNADEDSDDEGVEDEDDDE